MNSTQPNTTSNNISNKKNQPTSQVKVPKPSSKTSGKPSKTSGNSSKVSETNKPVVVTTETLTKLSKKTSNSESNSKSQPRKGKKLVDCLKCTSVVVDKEVHTLEEAEQFYLKHKQLIDEVIELAGDIPYVGPYAQAVELFLKFAVKYGKDLKYLEEALDALVNKKLVLKREKAIQITKDIALKDTLVTIQKDHTPSISGNGTLVAKLSEKHTFTARVNISLIKAHTWSIGGRLISSLSVPVLKKQEMSLKDANIDLQVDSKTKKWSLSITDNIEIGSKFPDNTLAIVAGSDNGGYENALVEVTVGNASNATAFEMVDDVIDFSSLKSKNTWFKEMKKTLDLRFTSASIFVHPLTAETVVELTLIDSKEKLITCYLLDVHLNNDPTQRQVALVVGPDFTSRYIASTNANLKMTWGPLEGEDLKLERGVHL